MIRGGAASAGVSAALAFGAVAAADQSSVFGPQTLSGFIDLRAVATEGPREWLDGGVGKTRYGSVDGEGADAEIAEAALVWAPLFTFSLSGHVHVQAGPDQDRAVGPVEAFLVYRAPPRSPTRVSARAGLFFPPVSLEHDGPAWSPTRTLTPSAINSWIGEEVAVTGVEGAVRRPFGGHEVEARAAVFGANDTAGALLAYRGWALHDVKTTAGGSFALDPTLNERADIPAQAARTRPIREIDDRAGWYGRLTWRPPVPVDLSVIAFDNNADPETIDQDGQYGWRTRFVNAGAQWRVTDRWELLGQVMVGETAMGAPGEYEGGERMFESDFASAYALLSTTRGLDTFSVRADWFDIDGTEPADFSTNEHGWAATAAWRRPLSDRLLVTVEALAVESDRPARLDDPEGLRETTVQTALRWSF